MEIAGQHVWVEPVLGQNTTRLMHGAIVRPEHGHLPIINKDVGVDLDADWNSLLPQDKTRRRYLLALFQDPKPQVERIRWVARRHVLMYGGGGAAAGAALALGVGAGLRARRVKLSRYPLAVASVVARHNRRLRWVAGLGTVGVILLLDAMAVAVFAHADHHVIVGNPILEGTALEGTEVNGLMSEVLPFVAVLRPRNDFYDEVAANLSRALTERGVIRPTTDDTVFVLAEDFEDVNGMARQVGLTASLVGADFIALTGDLTFAGTRVESYIIDTVDYYSQDRPVYLAPGLHDTSTILAAAQARGWHVAWNTVENVHGVRVLSLTDPRVSTVGRFGVDDLLRDPDVDTGAFVEKAIRTACDDPPDLVLIHDHVLGRRIAQAGCQTTAVLDGRSYRFLGPHAVSTSSGGESVEFTSGSAGGHRSTRPDPGTVKHPATFSVFSVNADTHASWYSTVTVHPDASVSVTPPSRLAIPGSP